MSKDKPTSENPVDYDYWSKILDQVTAKPGEDLMDDYDRSDILNELTVDPFEEIENAPDPQRIDDLVNSRIINKVGVNTARNLRIFLDRYGIMDPPEQSQQASSRSYAKLANDYGIGPGTIQETESKIRREFHRINHDLGGSFINPGPENQAIILACAHRIRALLENDAINTNFLGAQGNILQQLEGDSHPVEYISIPKYAQYLGIKNGLLHFLAEHANIAPREVTAISTSGKDGKRPTLIRWLHNRASIDREFKAYVTQFFQDARSRLNLPADLLRILSQFVVEITSPNSSIESVNLLRATFKRALKRGNIKDEELRSQLRNLSLMD